MTVSPDTQPYFVHQLKLGPWDNFVYFIGDRQSRTCAVVDPAWHAPSILAQAEALDLKITQILCTHSHFDHVDQVPELLKTLDIPVHMLRQEVDFSGFKCENLKPGSPGDRIQLGQHTQIRMMHTPGHTPGSTCFGLDDGVVCGDTLFVQGCGRCDFVGGDPEIMYRTLHSMIQSLDKDTLLYPGHDYGDRPYATVDHELSHNPWLGYSTLEEFCTHRMKGRTPNSPLPPRPDWSPSNA